VAAVAQGLFAALFPSDCRLCGAPLVNISRLPVCLECISAIEPIPVGTCEICGEGMATLARPELPRPELARPDEDRPEEAQTCDACREARPQFEKACAYGSYDGELRDLIHLLKYEQVTPAAGVLGGMLAGAIAKLNISQPVLIIPVPLHSSKRRQRRFNQAELIARAALKGMAIPGAELATNVLVRQRATVSQIGLTRPQRAENIRGAFRVQHPEKIAGRSILVVDDVLTTGTTASECARVLRKAGAAKVWVATVARTLKHSGRKSASNVEGDPEVEIVARAS
jgi:ComF family protein